MMLYFPRNERDGRLIFDELRKCLWKINLLFI